MSHSDPPVRIQADSHRRTVRLFVPVNEETDRVATLDPRQARLAARALVMAAESAEGYPISLTRIQEWENEARDAGLL